jgi:flap endonuclease-1
VEEKQFAEERVAKAIERLKKCKGKQTQNRLEDFFGKATVVPSQKRKQPEPKKGGKGKAPAKKGKK